MVNTKFVKILLEAEYNNNCGPDQPMANFKVKVSSELGQFNIWVRA